MTQLARLAIATVLISAFSLPAHAWTGPQVSLDNKNGRKVLELCDQGGGCSQSTPFFLSINTQTNAIGNHDWSTFMYEAQLQLNFVSASSNGVVPMLQVHLLSTSDAFLDELASKLNQLSPKLCVCHRPGAAERGWEQLHRHSQVPLSEGAAEPPAPAAARGVSGGEQGL